MRISILIILSVLSLPFWGTGQSLEKVLEVGDEAYQSRDYFTAYRCYETVLGYEDEKYSRPQRLLTYQLGLTAQRFNYYTKADSVFADLMVISEDNNIVDSIYARTLYYRAEVGLALEEGEIDHNLVRTWFSRVADSLWSITSANPDLQRRYQQAAQAGLNKLEYSLARGGWSSRDTLHRLTSGAINSGYSDMAPIMAGDTLFFSSVRFDPKPLKRRKQSTTYSKNLYALFQQNDTLGMDTLVREMPEQARFNSEDHFTVHRAVTEDDQWMVFSSCEPVADTIRCQLYQRRRLSSGGWGDPELMALNADRATVTTKQPAFAFDCNTGKYWLYFVSDRPGTLGGLDIWRAAFDTKTGQTEAVENLGSPVNSRWNEASPFFHQLAQTLYFSSDAPPGFGNYDLFKSQRTPFGWSPPENLGTPYNTGYNDMYFFTSGDGSQFYLSSDRPRSKRFDESIDACCQDIYAGERSIDRKLAINLVQCEQTLTDYPPSVMKVSELAGCDAKALVDTALVGDVQLDFDVKRFRQYRIEVSNEMLGMSIDTLIDLNDPIFDTLQTAELSLVFLPDFLELQVASGFIFEGDLVEVGSPKVRDAQGRSVQPFEGENTFRLMLDQVYEIEIDVAEDAAQIAGLTRDPLKLYPATLEGVYFPAEVCQRVCKSKVDIPLRAVQEKEYFIYFHNDKPNRAGRVEGGFRGYTSVTDQTLLGASDEYYALKTDYLNSVPDAQGKDATERFFENELANGPKSLRELAQDLIKFLPRLQEGEQLELVLQGVCSNLGSKVYNDSLALRRIQCIREFLEIQEMDGQRLGDFMGPKGSGRPIITVAEPVGISDASKRYPEWRGAQRYSLAAALDRRVDIRINLPEQQAPSLSVLDLSKDCTQNHDNQRKNPEQ